MSRLIEIEQNAQRVRNSCDWELPQSEVEFLLEKLSIARRALEKANHALYQEHGPDDHEWECYLCDEFKNTGRALKEIHS